MENQQGERYAERKEISDWLRDFDNRCWWCGSEDLSSEHKFKRSDLKNLSGGGPLVWGSWGSDGSSTELQELRSDNDKRARFAKRNLCQRCNNERSQPADRAWEKFSTFVAEHWKELGQDGSVDMADVFGDADGEEGSARIREYIVRHLGTRISSDGMDVPDDFRKYLDGEPPPTMAMCLFYSHERAASMRELGSTGHLSIGPLIANLSKSQKRATMFASELCIGPVGALIKWSDDEAVGTSFNSIATLFPRTELPYPEIHNPWPFQPGSERQPTR